MSKLCNNVQVSIWYSGRLVRRKGKVELCNHTLLLMIVVAGNSALDFVRLGRERGMADTTTNNNNQLYVFCAEW